MSINRRIQDALERQLSSMSLVKGQPLTSDLLQYAKPREIAIYEEETNQMNELLEEIRKRRVAIDKLRRSRYSLRNRLYDRRDKDRKSKANPETQLAELMDRDAKIYAEKVNDEA